MSNTKISKKIKILVDGKVIGEVEHFNISETKDIKPVYDVGIDELIILEGEAITKIEFPPLINLPPKEASLTYGFDGYLAPYPIIFSNKMPEDYFGFTSYPLTGFTKIVGTDKHPIPAPKKSPPYRCKKIKDTGPTLPKVDHKVIMEELGAEELVVPAKIQPFEYVTSKEKDQIINDILSYGSDEDIKKLAKTMSLPAKSPENIKIIDESEQQKTQMYIEELLKTKANIKEMVEAAANLAKLDIVLGPEFYIDHGDCPDFPELPPAKRDPGPGKIVSPKSESLWKKIKKLWI